MGLEQEIEEIEAEIAETPYNKSTEKHIGRLKAKLAELRDQLERQQSGDDGGPGYHVAKTGDATVAMVGFPSVGKSTLLNALTNAESEVGAYDFTTIEVNPGMLAYRGTQIQLLDVPGLIEGAAGGRGRGREVLSMVRASDLVLIVLSPYNLDRYRKLLDELYANKIRLDESPPRVSIRPKGRGGIDVTAVRDFDLDEDTVAEVVREQGYVNADVHIAEAVDVDRLIDGIMDNRVYLPSVVAVNKMDTIEPDELEDIEAELRRYDLDTDDVVYISAEHERGLETLKERIWDALDLRRVYMRKPGEDPDFDEPLVVPAGTTVEGALDRIGGDFQQRFRYARVSGPSASHEDQRIGPDHELADEDVLTLVLRR